MKKKWLEKIHSVKNLNTIGKKKDESSNFSRWAWNSNARIHNKNSKTNGKNWKETYFKTHRALPRLRQRPSKTVGVQALSLRWLPFRTTKTSPPYQYDF